MVRDRAQHAGIILQDNIDDSTPDICAGERRLKQVLVNILSNAVKFTEEGGKVSIDSETLNDGGLALTITDTGIGMDDKGLAKALEKFGQVHSQNNNPTDGTGPGLPLTKGLIEAHGGALVIESALGEGTTVRVELPSSRVVQ